MKTLGISFCFLLLASATLAESTGDTRPDIVLDEDVWVLFYDLPSGRFRNARVTVVDINYDLS